jgi:hypothetical protein
MATVTNDPPAPGRAMTPPAALEEGDGTLQRPYTVHLPGFDGPLDLLLHLIERNQLEITTISLVTVTDQFVAYLRTWDEPSPQIRPGAASRAACCHGSRGWKSSTTSPIRWKTRSSCVAISSSTRPPKTSRAPCAHASWRGCSPSPALAACWTLRRCWCGVRPSSSA